MSNVGLFTVVTVLLLGIFTIMIIHTNEDSSLERIAGNSTQSAENITEEADVRT